MLRNHSPSQNSNLISHVFASSHDDECSSRQTDPVLNDDCEGCNKQINLLPDSSNCENMLRETEQSQNGPGKHNSASSNFKLPKRTLGPIKRHYTRPSFYFRKERKFKQTKCKSQSTELFASTTTHLSVKKTLTSPKLDEDTRLHYHKLASSLREEMSKRPNLESSKKMFNSCESPPMHNDQYLTIDPYERFLVQTNHKNDQVSRLNNHHFFPSSCESSSRQNDRYITKGLYDDRLILKASHNNDQDSRPNDRHFDPSCKNSSKLNDQYINKEPYERLLLESSHNTGLDSWGQNPCRMSSLCDQRFKRNEQCMTQDPYEDRLYLKTRSSFGQGSKRYSRHSVSPSCESRWRRNDQFMIQDASDDRLVNHTSSDFSHDSRHNNKHSVSPFQESTSMSKEQYKSQDLRDLGEDSRDNRRHPVSPFHESTSRRNDQYVSQDQHKDRLAWHTSVDFSHDCSSRLRKNEQCISQDPYDNSLVKQTSNDLDQDPEYNNSHSFFPFHETQSRWNKKYPSQDPNVAEHNCTDFSENSGRIRSYPLSPLHESGIFHECGPRRNRQLISQDQFGQDSRSNSRRSISPFHESGLRRDEHYISQGLHDDRLLEHASNDFDENSRHNDRGSVSPFHERESRPNEQYLAQDLYDFGEDHRHNNRHPVSPYHESGPRRNQQYISQDPYEDRLAVYDSSDFSQDSRWHKRGSVSPFCESRSWNNEEYGQNSDEEDFVLLTSPHQGQDSRHYSRDSVSPLHESRSRKNDPYMSHDPYDDGFVLQKNNDFGQDSKCNNNYSVFPFSENISRKIQQPSQHPHEGRFVLNTSSDRGQGTSCHNSYSNFPFCESKSSKKKQYMKSQASHCASQDSKGFSSHSVSSVCQRISRKDTCEGQLILRTSQTKVSQFIEEQHGNGEAEGRVIVKEADITFSVAGEETPRTAEGKMVIRNQEVHSKPKRPSRAAKRKLMKKIAAASGEPVLTWKEHRQRAKGETEETALMSHGRPSNLSWVMPKRPSESTSQTVLQGKLKNRLNDSNNEEGAVGSNEPYRETPQDQWVVVVPCGYPKVVFTRTLVKEFEDKGALELLGLVDTEHCPRLLYSYLDEGAYVLHCATIQCAEWLSKFVKRIILSGGVALRLGTPEDGFWTAKVSLLARKPLDRATPADILQMVRRQNPELAKDEWNIVSCNTVPKGRIIVLSIGEQSLKALQQKKRKVFIGMNLMSCRILSTRRLYQAVDDLH